MGFGFFSATRLLHNISCVKAVGAECFEIGRGFLVLHKRRKKPPEAGQGKCRAAFSGTFGIFDFFHFFLFFGTMEKIPIKICTKMIQSFPHFSLC